MLCKHEVVGSIPSASTRNCKTAEVDADGEIVTNIQCVQTVRAIWAAPDLVRGITSLVGLTRSTAGFMTS